MANFISITNSNNDVDGYINTNQIVTFEKTSNQSISVNLTNGETIELKYSISEFKEAITKLGDNVLTIELR